MERKQLSGISIKQPDEGRVTVRFATFGVKDLDGDIILPGAIGSQRVKVSAFGHESWKGALPVGVGKTRERGAEARADLQFFLNTTHGSAHFETLKGLGDLAEWSFGFDVVAAAQPDEEQRQAGVQRILKSLKVHELSPVLRGAGVGTQTLAIKCNQCGVATLPPGRRELERAALALGDAKKTLLRGRDPGGDEHRFYSYLGHVLTGCPGRILEPDVKLFDRNELPRTDAYMLPGSAETYVASDLHGEELARAILHEAKHHQQCNPRAPEAEQEAEVFAAKWAGPVFQAYRWADGPHRVRISRNRQPPFQGIARHGDVMLQEPDARAWFFNRRATTSPWQTIG